MPAFCITSQGIRLQVVRKIELHCPGHTGWRPLIRTGPSHVKKFPPSGGFIRRWQLCGALRPLSCAGEAECVGHGCPAAHDLCFKFNSLDTRSQGKGSHSAKLSTAYRLTHRCSTPLTSCAFLPICPEYARMSERDTTVKMGSTCLGLSVPHLWSGAQEFLLPFQRTFPFSSPSSARISCVRKPHCSITQVFFTHLAQSSLPVHTVIAFASSFLAFRHRRPCFAHHRPSPIPATFLFLWAQLKCFHILTCILFCKKGGPCFRFFCFIMRLQLVSGPVIVMSALVVAQCFAA